MVNVIRGASDKPTAANKLAKFFEEDQADVQGTLYLGYPIIGTAQGGYQIDALLVSRNHGVIIFTLIEGTGIDVEDAQNESYTKLQSKLIQNKKLLEKKQLAVKMSAVTYAPAFLSRVKSNLSERYSLEEYPLLIKNEELQTFLNGQHWENSDKYFEQLNSVIQAITTIRKRGQRSYVKQENSRGAKLRKLEESIANLDRDQNKAVIETVEGVQRIRGLAGSGKTIVLALKVAYLHSVHPEWKIAITFNTRSLKGQLKHLINTFTIEQTNEEPNWDNIKIIHAWGSPNNEGGIYYEICTKHNIEYFDFRGSRNLEPLEEDPFGRVCKKAVKEINEFQKYYDVILVDEAQDFSSSFLQLCYGILKEPKRLVYAYDELQNLSQDSMPSPEILFGKDNHGNPNVTLRNISGEPKRDIILSTCYRNSRPILSSAHALGFGIYRSEGLVQMFESASLWQDIGYSVKSGNLEDSQSVKLERTNESSPRFLENHSSIDDLIVFTTFENNKKQVQWLVQEIKRNLHEDELKPDDIMVIHPNARTSKPATSSARALLYEDHINSELAGSSTSPDIFFKDDSVVFTQIYRAKGNEAAMVYLINAQECLSDFNMAQKRNILFTAITRSKAWVRVIGYGLAMKKLEEEFLKIKQQNFALSFTYPSQEQREKMNLINKEISPQKRNKLQTQTKALDDMVNSLERGEISKENIPEELRKKLTQLLE